MNDTDKRADINIHDWVLRGLPVVKFGEPMPQPEAKDAREPSTPRVYSINGNGLADHINTHYILASDFECYVQARLASAREQGGGNNNG